MGMIYSAAQSLNKRLMCLADKWILNCNNGNSHSSFRKQFPAKKQMLALEHPLYLPDLVTCDFFHVQKTKNFLERVSFWMTWRHSEKCEYSAERTFGKQFPPIFASMVEMLEECIVRRKVLLRYSKSLKVNDSTYFFHRINLVI